MQCPDSCTARASAHCPMVSAWMAGPSAIQEEKAMQAFRTKSAGAAAYADLLPPDRGPREAAPAPRRVDYVDAEFETVSATARRNPYPVFNDNRRHTRRHGPTLTVVRDEQAAAQAPVVSRRDVGCAPCRRAGSPRLSQLSPLRRLRLSSSFRPVTGSNASHWRSPTSLRRSIIPAACGCFRSTAPSTIPLPPCSDCRWSWWMWSAMAARLRRRD